VYLTSDKVKSDREAVTKPRPDRNNRVSKYSRFQKKTRPANNTSASSSKPLHQEEKLKGIAPTLIEKCRNENL
jgi:hypothetical protein